MTTLYAAPAPPALQAPADTVVTVAARSGLEIAADVAMISLTVVLALLVLVLAIQLLKLRSTVRSLGDKLLDKADPAIQSARGVGENVEFITGVVREDIQEVHRLVNQTTERLERASDLVEERIEEFNALMDVVQEEAEEIFIGTASTVRGVRAGARSLGEGEARDDVPPADPVSAPRRPEPAPRPPGSESGAPGAPEPGTPGAGVPSQAPAPDPTAASDEEEA